MNMIACYEYDIMQTGVLSINQTTKIYVVYLLQTVEKRRAELSVYLMELLALESQISESDVVYTFLHCLIRDEQDLTKLKEGRV